MEPISVELLALQVALWVVRQSFMNMVHSFLVANTSPFPSAGIMKEVPAVEDVVATTKALQSYPHPPDSNRWKESA